jgi:hypothetical protein
MGIIILDYHKAIIRVEPEVQVGDFGAKDYAKKVPQSCRFESDSASIVQGSIFTGVPTSTMLYNSIASFGYM